jgi:ABC-type antimicrobial peptide transport system permease subunit
VIERERQRDLIAGIPGVEDASFTTYTPGGAGTLPYTVVQRESGRYVEIATIYIDDHYFDLLGIPLVYGQNIDPTDNTQLVGNESYAIATFGRADSVGEVTRTDRTLRGVVQDVAYGHPAEAVPLIGYTAWARTSYPILLLKTPLAPPEMRRLLQQKIDAGALEIELGNIDRLENVASRDLRADRARTILTVNAALLVVILAALGFYGTQRYLVTAGQREYAIRSALGAGPRALGRLVFFRSLKLGLPGLVFGSVLALLTVSWLRDRFLARAVSPVSVSMMVMLLILALVLAATVGPALQARKTAPAALLRED